MTRTRPASWMVLVALTIIGQSGAVSAHGGGIDAHGGHNNRKAGTYHFHKGQLKGKTFGTKAEALKALGIGSQTVVPVATPRSETPAESNPLESVDTAPVQSPDTVAQEWNGAEVYTISYVVDGDTVALLGRDGGLVKVRLIGVDTPETVHPSKPVEHYGREASLFLTNLLKGESVFVVYGLERTDRYGRTLAYLFRAPDGLFVNAEIIRQGYGHAYTRFPFKHMELFKGYQRLAQESGKGLWAQ